MSDLLFFFLVIFVLFGKEEKNLLFIIWLASEPLLIFGNLIDIWVNGYSSAFSSGARLGRGFPWYMANMVVSYLCFDSGLLYKLNNSNSSLKPLSFKNFLTDSQKCFNGL